MKRGYICHDCGAWEGQIHHWGCDMEECPKCGRQLISCDCQLSEQQATNLGRVPHIVWPNLCARCGELWPDMFMVPDREWKRYVPKSKRGKMLCRRCYDEIRKLVDAGDKG